MLLVRYPLGSVIIAGALAATAAVFMFVRPQYQAPDYGGRVIDLSGFPPPAHGWTWADGQPGYRFGVREEDWNFAQLSPAELEPAGKVAARLGMNDLQPLNVERYAPRSLGLIVAATNRAGRTCLGFVLPTRPITFNCPDKAAAFVAVVPNQSGAFVFGIGRSDVRAVTIEQAGQPPLTLVGSSGRGPWGTFSVTLAGRSARLNLGGRTIRLLLTQTAPRLLRVAG